MADLLILHLILAFTVGGAWVSSATLIAERYGSALGGLVGGLPAISIVSFLFIGLNQGATTASQAYDSLPSRPQLYNVILTRLRGSFGKRFPVSFCRWATRLGRPLNDHSLS